jgi:hypothetical protein
MRDKLRLFIPTRDSASWIGTILDFYKSLNLKPFVVIDSRTADHTREVILAKSVDFLEFTPRGDYPEAGMLEFAAQNANADWLLRLDDDELPSRGLIEFALDHGIKSKNQCWFIERRELYWQGDEVAYSRSVGKYPLPDYPQYLHPMARLYHVDRVKYLEEVHTTGFHELKLYGFAPPEAYIVHLNCLVNSFDRRLNKVLNYEKIKPGVSWGLADEYLPELFDGNFHNYSRDGLQEFDSVIHIVSTPSGTRDLQLVGEVSDFAHACVWERSKKISEDRLHSRGGILSADDVSWIENVPQRIRYPLAKFLCSLSNKRLNKVGLAIWDYLEIHQSPQNR